MKNKIFKGIKIVAGLVTAITGTCVAIGEIRKDDKEEAAQPIMETTAEVVGTAEVGGENNSEQQQ